MKLTDDIKNYFHSHFQLLEELGTYCWIGGGCIRDYFLKNDPKDIDIFFTSKEDVLQARDILCRKGFHPIEHTPTHCTLQKDGITYDLCYGAAKNVTCAEEWIESVDFSICAAAIDNNLNLYYSDNFIDDVEGKILRVVGSSPFCSPNSKCRRLKSFIDRGFTIDDNNLKAYLDTVNTHQPTQNINKLVDNIYVLNLQRDEWRYDILARKLSKHNIEHQRFIGVDGGDISGGDEEKRKAYKRIIEEYEHEPFYDRLVSRAAHALACKQAGAFRTSGAMGCLQSHRNIIQDAIDKKYKKILIFQDDIYFHNKFGQMLARLTPTIESSVMTHLGAFEWNEPVKRDKWPDPNWNFNKCKYATTENTCGMWATVVGREMFEPFMRLSRFRLMSADLCFSFLGFNQFFKSSWVAHPNIIVSDTSHSNTSSTQEKEFIRSGMPMANEYVKDVFGWDLKYYDLSERYYNE